MQLTSHQPYPMKTFQSLLALCLSAAMLSSCINNRVEGTGNIVSENRDLSGFDNVQISNVITTNVSYGEEFSVVVNADEVAISNVLTKVSGNTLMIDLEKNQNYENIRLQVDITMPSILHIHHDGVSNSSLSGFRDLDILEVTHQGVGNLNLEGSANKLFVNHSGVGKLKAFGFSAKSCDIDFSGVGNMELTVTEMLEGELSGVGNISYKGHPEVKIKDDGVGNVSNAN